jgi:hypothetical protein
VATADDVWDAIEAAELQFDGVSPGTGFGRSSGLRIAGKLYVIRREAALILKLPRGRVDALIATGRGAAWGPSPARIMKEWVEVGADAAAEWPELVAEARRFVGP